MYNMSHIKDYVSDNVQTQNNVSFIKLQSVKLKNILTKVRGIYQLVWLV